MLTRPSAGPDFFIVGAPKCGTTAMSEFLAGHPDVWMCPFKETHHFAGEEYWRRSGAFRGDRAPTREEYLELFRAAPAVHRVGEASVWYLHSASAPDAIRAFRADADI